MANAPSRASGSVVLSWHLVQIPLSLYKGIEDSKYKGKTFTREGHEAGYAWIDKETGEQIEYDDTIKMFPTEHGWVHVDKDEESLCMTQTNSTAQVVAFIPLRFLMSGYYVPISFHQVRPGKGGKKQVHPQTARAYALLMEGLRTKNVFALISLSERNRQRFCALLPNGRLYELAFTEQIREDLPMPEVESRQEEVDQVSQLIDASLVSEPPELIDEQSHNLIAYATQKAQKEGEEGGMVLDPPDDDPTPQRGPDDLMGALKASMEAAQQ